MAQGLSTNTTVLYDKAGNPVSVVLDNGQYVLAHKDDNSRMLLEQILSEVQEINAKTPEDYPPLNAKVGPARLQDGDINQIRSCKTGELGTSDVHGRYYEAASRGNVYIASMTAAANMGTSLVAASATICLYNPQGSGVNLSLLNVNGVVATVGAGVTSIVLAAYLVQYQAAPTGPTQLVVRNALLASAAGKGQALSAGTFPAAPVVIKSLASVAASGSTTALVAVDQDIAGSILIPPNAAVVVQGVTTQLTGIFGFIWEEVLI